MKETTVNQIFRQYGEAFRKKVPGLSDQQKKIMRAIEQCRTPELGSRIEVCDHCGHTVILHHSCRNRHCPQCQFMKKEAWIEKKKHEVFPFQYFHLVFTLPHHLIPLVLRNKQQIYDLLFQTVKETLLSVSDEKKHFGARIGFFSILHTWGQKLNLHPHLHCVVPGGGLVGKKWIKSPKDFLFPVEVLKRRFRSLYLTGLKTLYNKQQLDIEGSEWESPARFRKLIDSLFKTDWVVYVKESFRNSDTVIEYLGRYTHRIAISNHRIVQIEDGKVSFRYKDYKQNNTQQVLTVSAEDFIRRFMQHTLPARYVRIRYYGIMANRNKRDYLANCLEYYNLEPKEPEEELPWYERMLKVTGVDVYCCPGCRKGKLFPLEEYRTRTHGPPGKTI